MILAEHVYVVNKFATKVDQEYYNQTGFHDQADVDHHQRNNDIRLENKRASLLGRGICRPEVK